MAELAGGRAGTATDEAKVGSGTSAPPQPPVGWRELVSVFLLVIVCDLTIYRGHGFAGYAFLFMLAPLLLVFGATGRQHITSACILSVMLAAVSVKLLWCGSVLLIGVGFACSVF